MLTKLYGFTFKKAIGYTLLVVGLFYNLVGAIVLYLISSIDISILPILLLGSFAGGYIGAMVAIKKIQCSDKNSLSISYTNSCI